MISFKKFLAFLALAGILMSPVLAFAAANQGTLPGVGTRAPDLDFFDWYAKLRGFVFIGIIIFAILIILLSAWDLVVAQGDAGKVGKAKEQITWVIIGVIVAFVAFAAVDLVLKQFK